MPANRPSVSLCMIVKNEEHNLPRLFESIEGCFDEVVVCDTGSTDKTVEIAKSFGARVEHFTWVNDFSKARNYAFSKATSDYICWLDGDDVLSDKQAFIDWRDNVMILADFWLASYWYAFDDKGVPVCTFARERVIKRSKAIRWRYFIHEGMIPDTGQEVKAQYTKSWHVNHMRTQADWEQDKGRNLSILGEAYENQSIPPRLMFYYGKELFDSGDPEKAVKIFDELSRDLNKLEHHDKILTYEYWVRSLLTLQHKLETENKEVRLDLIEKAYALATQGIALMPTRAELQVTAGDCLLRLGKLKEALSFYSAASVCTMPGPLEPSPMFFSKDAYTNIPHDQMARVYANIGELNKAHIVAKNAFDAFGVQTSKDIYEHVEKLMKEGQISTGVKKKTDEIIITCPEMACPYEWNDKIYTEKGIGGSETAAVEIAEWLAIKTKRPVIVFNRQNSDRISPNGVLYTSASKMIPYFNENEPNLHIAWRHNFKLTEAPTYLWCHDLMTPGAENTHYEKIICLSDFHRHYVKILQGLSDDKIQVSKNGINPARFVNRDNFKKKENKIVFPSSPDRELKRAIQIVELARNKNPELELHVYYGFDNLEKYGLGALANELRAMIAERPWIKYHGNIRQDLLADEMMEAAVWLYAPNFIETFCITAIEALSAHCYPLVRSIGALKDTLKWADSTGNAKLMHIDAETLEEKQKWADELCKIIEEKRWEKMNVNPHDFSWEKVADHFIEFMGLNVIPKIPETVFAQDAVLPEVVREYGQATV
jgi:glycosyltransferase involved in cell wall biosynthesis